MKSIIIYICLLFLVIPLQAQQVLGKVTSENEPLIGANIYWLGTTQGAITNEKGEFQINIQPTINQLVISYVGFIGDTLTIQNFNNYLEINLKPEVLKEVVIQSSTTTFLDDRNPIHTETLTGRELQKAACCNLSESFETNASVEVSLQDAVTGAKQIKMLGLEGNYSLISTENIPFTRGLATTYGLNYIPGTWIQAIDIGKGSGSVVNGYESFTGQINVELQKPDKGERYVFNTYANQMGRIEGNINLAHRFKGDKWSTGLLTHASTLQNKVDNNHDGFLDMPLFTQYNVLNRWRYASDRFISQFGVKVLHENREAGQTSFFPTRDINNFYGTGNVTNRVEVFAKNAILFPDKPYKGLGWIVSAVAHNQQGFFSKNIYEGQQRTLYSNLIYQSIIGNTNHTYKIGTSYLLDKYDEKYQDSTFARTESVIGLFGEYTYNYLDKFTLVAGVRTDFHNLFGNIITPRLHLKYKLTSLTILRASVGKGFRVANPIAEHTGILISARKLIVQEKLLPERAWNMGGSVSKEFFLFDRKTVLVTDFFRTFFTNQVIIDMDKSPQEVWFYNLKGVSYANSLQAELNYELIKQFSVKLAYKYYQVKTTLNNILQQRPLISQDRMLINLAYATKFEKWKFDLTLQGNGKKRLPNTTTNPDDLKLGNYSPAYFVLNAQVTKAYRKWDIYVGAENLTNFTQKTPIIDAKNPFGSYFDASIVWGPIIGRMIYTGIRFKIK